jgi:hypothetical protein
LVCGFLEFECFHGFVAESVRVTFTLHCGFYDPDRNDLLNCRGSAASLKRSAGPVEREAHRQDRGVVEMTVYTHNHLP